MIVFAKVNLKIYYPPPYYHQIWHHQDADTELLKNEIKIYSIGKKLMQIIWIRLKLQQKQHIITTIITTFNEKI